MSQLTRNLFYGSGTGEHWLEAISGEWPEDIEGAAFVIGPDKREPGGHWLGHHGFIYRIDCTANNNGKVHVLAKRVETPLNRLRTLLPWLFGKMSALEFSPFGISNLANTNLQILKDRMFVGYDIGRPIEVDPDTLKFVSFVGSNDEWLQAVPAMLLLEPQISVAAHPAADYETNTLYFVNYSQVPNNDGLRNASICEWDTQGKIKRWPVENMGRFDTIHDIKSTRHYLVFTDLPFIVEPASMYGKPRKHANQDICQMWIIDKRELSKKADGESVNAQYVRFDKPAGHIKVDVNDDSDILTIYLQHIPATDLGLVISPFEKQHQSKESYDADYEGFISVGPQPNATGKHRVNAKTGEVLSSEYCWDKDAHWNSLLWTDNIYDKEARETSRFLWSTTIGLDTSFVMDSAYRLYKNSDSAFVPLNSLPEQDILPSIVRTNLETMQYDDAYYFEAGQFAHPPTFIPRKNARAEDDGYVMVFLNKDKPKELQLFDAANLAKGPVVRMTAEGFNPPVMLHTSWKAPSTAKEVSNYKIGLIRDLLGALITWPKTAAFFFRYAKNMNKRFEVK